MIIKIIFNIIIIFSFLFITNLAQAIEPGDKSGDFKIENFDGKTYRLSDNTNASAIVIMFWSTECPFVQPYTDRINALTTEYTKKNIVFWGINSNKTESADRVKEHLNERGYPFPMLKDEGNTVADLFGATRTPEIFVLDKNLTVLYHGRIDDNKNESEVTTSDLKNALDEILAGKEVANKSTKQFGCTIKR
ncbi:MAG: thioredoxin family protein [Ignavibacteriae bacterium]|nr:thioredoxin family protein [Ignavibacteriota bacterium]